jgi:GAF domain-containing protein
MAEAFQPDQLATDKTGRYRDLTVEIAAVLDGELDLTARMATVSSMLRAAFAHFYWVGFYVVDPLRTDELVVGPYQGTLGCLRIAFSRGVCGAAARERRTVVVEDVETFPGHIACDSRSRSEIVVPVLGPDGALIAVLDVDAETPAAFDAVDAQGLETILHDIFSR